MFTFLLRSETACRMRIRFEIHVRFQVCWACVANQGEPFLGPQTRPKSKLLHSVRRATIIETLYVCALSRPAKRFFGFPRTCGVPAPFFSNRSKKHVQIALRLSHLFLAKLPTPELDLPYCHTLKLFGCTHLPCVPCPFFQNTNLVSLDHTCYFQSR